MNMEMTISEIFDEVGEIDIYRNGLQSCLLPSQIGFKLVINGFKNMLAGARQMPAFGVSLNDETRSAMNRGLWVEFCFGQKLYYSEMPFEKLLVQVAAEYTGFNVVRYNSENGYAGRCYYFDINGDMSDFYSVLTSV